MTRRVSKSKKGPPPRRRWRRVQRMGAWVPLGVIVVVAVGAVAAFIVIGNRSSGSSPVDIPPITVRAEGRTLGPDNARVAVDEYSDFQCPFCARAAETILPKIQDQYIADGRVRWVYHPMAFIGDESVVAAEAAECANEQGKFWDYANKLFENQKGENQGAFSTDNLKRFAQELGLDTQAFNQCLDSRKYEQAIKTDSQNALNQGISTTPTFIVGDQTVRGADLQQVQSAIEAALRKNP